MFMKEYVLIRNLAILFMVGDLLYWFFPFQPIVWRVAFVLLSLYAILFKVRRMLPCEKVVMFFAVFNLIHFFISFLWLEPQTTHIGNTLCAMLSLSLFILLSQKGVVTNKFLSFTSILLLLAVTMNFYNAGELLRDEMGVGNDVGITNNATVGFLLLLPIVFLLKNNILKWVMLITCLFFIILGAKRGNIIAAAVPVLLFVHYELRDIKNSNKRGIRYVVVIGAIAMASYLVYHWAMSNDYFMLRVEQTMEGNSSGRDKIYKGAWRAWAESNNFIILLFGYGYDGTVHNALMGHSRAHSDWLEILVNYGLVGIAIYLAIFISFAKQIIQIKSIEMKMTLLSAILIWLLKSFYSMGFTEGSMYLLMISMGTVLGRYKTEK